ncbi:dTDP-4-dehydrorhamnose 3,5-epimerase [alpha proteobacterium U9-1i]|nr:dTDP-4-dehydrorhamnose 3,5-epimerase [alpha proteobacterium U9-1i]
MSRARYDVLETDIAGVLVVETEPKDDSRGPFLETFRASAFAAHGVTHGWMQDNQALTYKAGIVRGMHFQAPPNDQAKLLRVISGAIYDVAVDIRRASRTYGRFVGRELSAANGRQLYVPSGFAHGYCTLSDNTTVVYKVSAEYAPGGEGGLSWNDPALAIDWPLPAAQMTSTERDLNWPAFAAFQSPF